MMDPALLNVGVLITEALQKGVWLLQPPPQETRFCSDTGPEDDEPVFTPGCDTAEGGSMILL
ncbi:hypothetical protein [Endozoicomonas sp. ONNA2]|uniref:hypothetical protein n=1 Tax=Endozoicomonas sp. ONNA2 TaxID=2828741 RepID=UPI002147793D|nr:hypothetical protein [Endozoicomonas sp. ONNA2]